MTEIYVPPEWAPRRALWTAWPHDAEAWFEPMADARDEFAAMIRALAAMGETVKVLAHGAGALASARAALRDAAEIVPEAYGDTWLRDTGPIFARRGDEKVALGFRFNGWGGKYLYPHDDEVAAAIARRAGIALIRNDFVLEGGAIELDGEGTLLTTRQCVLNPNRNPSWSERDAERALCAAFGVEKVLWLDEGLANDHTDGHIDNIARFVAPGIILCQHPVQDDPNTDVLEKIALTLAAMTDARGRKLEVVRIPSPGRVLGPEGEVMAASHVNFIRCEHGAVTPIYAAAAEAPVAEALQALGPAWRDIRCVRSNAILTGGGSLHCVTQQEPA